MFRCPFILAMFCCVIAKVGVKDVWMGSRGRGFNTAKVLNVYRNNELDLSEAVQELLRRIMLHVL